MGKERGLTFTEHIPWLSVQCWQVMFSDCFSSSTTSNSFIFLSIFLFELPLCASAVWDTEDGPSWLLESVNKRCAIGSVKCWHWGFSCLAFWDSSETFPLSWSLLNMPSQGFFGSAVGQIGSGPHMDHSLVIWAWADCSASQASFVKWGWDWHFSCR